MTNRIASFAAAHVNTHRAWPTVAQVAAGLGQSVDEVAALITAAPCCVEVPVYDAETPLAARPVEVFEHA